MQVVTCDLTKHYVLTLFKLYVHTQALFRMFITTAVCLGGTYCQLPDCCYSNTFFQYPLSVIFTYIHLHTENS